MFDSERSAGADPRRSTTAGRIVEALLWTPTGFLGLLVLLAAIVLAVLAPWMLPLGPGQIDLAHRLTPPSLTGGPLLGTDQLGKDVLARVIYGSRLSLMIGILAVGLSSVIGVTIGLLSGYFGRALDAAFMRAADVQLAFPFILLAIAIVGALGPTVPNIVAVLALS